MTNKRKERIAKERAEGLKKAAALADIRKNGRFVSVDVLEGKYWRFYARFTSMKLARAYCKEKGFAVWEDASEEMRRLYD